MSRAREEPDRARSSSRAHPLYGKPLSPDRGIYQLMRMTADDIDFSSVSLTLDFRPDLLDVLFPELISQRFPSHAGLRQVLRLRPRQRARRRSTRSTPARSRPKPTSPSPRGSSTSIRRRRRSCRSPAPPLRGATRTTRATWSTGPAASIRWRRTSRRRDTRSCPLPLGGTPIEDSLLATFDTAAATQPNAASTSLTLPRTNEDDFDETYAVTVRVTVQDSLGNRRQARTQHHAAPRRRRCSPASRSTSASRATRRRCCATWTATARRRSSSAPPTAACTCSKPTAASSPGWPVETDLDAAANRRTGVPAGGARQRLPLVHPRRRRRSATSTATATTKSWPPTWTARVYVFAGATERRWRVSRSR